MSVNLYPNDPFLSAMYHLSFQVLTLSISNLPIPQLQSRITAVQERVRQIQQQNFKEMSDDACKDYFQRMMEGLKEFSESPDDEEGTRGKIHDLGLECLQFTTITSLDDEANEKLVALLNSKLGDEEIKDFVELCKQCLLKNNDLFYTPFPDIDVLKKSPRLYKALSEIGVSFENLLPEILDTSRFSDFFHRVLVSTLQSGTPEDIAIVKGVLSALWKRNEIPFSKFLENLDIDLFKEDNYESTSAFLEAISFFVDELNIKPTDFEINVICTETTLMKLAFFIFWGGSLSADQIKSWETSKVSSEPLLDDFSLFWNSVLPEDEKASELQSLKTSAAQYAAIYKLAKENVTSALYGPLGRDPMGIVLQYDNLAKTIFDECCRISKEGLSSKESLEKTPVIFRLNEEFYPFWEEFTKTTGCSKNQLARLSHEEQTNLMKDLTSTHFYRTLDDKKLSWILDVLFLPQLLTHPNASKLCKKITTKKIPGLSKGDLEKLKDIPFMDDDLLSVALINDEDFSSSLWNHHNVGKACFRLMLNHFPKSVDAANLLIHTRVFREMNREQLMQVLEKLLDNAYIYVDRDYELLGNFPHVLVNAVVADPLFKDPETFRGIELAPRTLLFALQYNVSGLIRYIVKNDLIQKLFDSEVIPQDMVEHFLEGAYKNNELDLLAQILPYYKTSYTQPGKCLKALMYAFTVTQPNSETIGH